MSFSFPFAGPKSGLFNALMTTFAFEPDFVLVAFGLHQAFIDRLLQRFLRALLSLILLLLRKARKRTSVATRKIVLESLACHDGVVLLLGEVLTLLFLVERWRLSTSFLMAIAAEHRFDLSR